MRNDFEPQDSNEEEYGSHKGVIVACGIVLVALLVGGGIIGIKNMTSSNDSNDSADISSSLAIRNDREFELGSKVVLSKNISRFRFDEQSFQIHIQHGNQNCNR